MLTIAYLKCSDSGSAEGRLRIQLSNHTLPDSAETLNHVRIPSTWIDAGANVIQEGLRWETIIEFEVKQEIHGISR